MRECQGSLAFPVAAEAAAAAPAALVVAVLAVALADDDVDSALPPPPPPPRKRKHLAQTGSTLDNSSALRAYVKCFFPDDGGLFSMHAAFIQF